MIRHLDTSVRTRRAESIATNPTKLRRSNAHTLCVEDSLRAPLNRELRDEVRALLHRGERAVVLDLTRVATIDAAGVGELVRAYNMTIGANGMLRVVHATRSVRQILERAGLFDLLSADWDSQ